MNTPLARFALHTIAAIALVFGLLSIFSGGRVLFGQPAAQEAAGNYMPFVVWFNFLAGFAYVAAASGLARRQPWAVRLSLGIAVATALVFLVFGVLALTGTPFEMRTVAAMTLRTLLWTGIAWLSSRQIYAH